MESSPFPHHFPMGFNREALYAFLLKCSTEKVADITAQSGDFIWGRHNRTYVKLSDRQLQDVELGQILTWLHSNTATPELLSGKALDFRAVATESRDHVKYFRANAVKARIGQIDSGIQLTLRTIPEHPPTLDALGIEEEIMDNLFPRYGLVLVVGTTGSGKSTFLAASNRWRLERRRHDPVKIITFEDPIEYTFAGLAEGSMPEPAQTEVGRGQHLSNFDLAGPNAMRRASDVIVMGEMRDAESVGSALEMAGTGHATYSTLHTDTPAEAIDRIISFYPFGAQASTANKLLSSLRMIVAQKLARRKDGGVIAFRSWMVFDQARRRRLSALPFERIAATVREECAANGSDFETQVARAYAADLISFETAREVANLTVDEARILLKTEECTNA